MGDVMLSNKFLFWQKFLLVVSIVMVLMGLFIALLNRSTVFNFVFNEQINPAFFSNNDLSSSTQLFQNWIYGVLGATIIGWGIFILFIAKYPFKEQQTWSWNCLATGITVWFVIDTAISAYFNVLFNVIFNAILLLLIIIPLLLTKKYFNSTLKIN